jgi:hypothetical protein
MAFALWQGRQRVEGLEHGAYLSMMPDDKELPRILAKIRALRRDCHPLMAADFGPVLEALEHEVAAAKLVRDFFNDRARAPFLRIR